MRVWCWVIGLLASSAKAFTSLQQHHLGGRPFWGLSHQLSSSALSSTIVSIGPHLEEDQEEKDYRLAKDRLLKFASGQGFFVVDEAAQKEFKNAIRLLENAVDGKTFPSHSSPTDEANGSYKNEMSMRMMSNDWTLLCSTASPAIGASQLASLFPTSSRTPIKKLQSNLLSAFDKYMAVQQKICASKDDRLEHVVLLKHPETLNEILPDLTAGDVNINPLAIQNATLTLSYGTTQKSGTTNIQLEKISWTITRSRRGWNSRDNTRSGSIRVASNMSPTIGLEPIFVDDDILIIRGSSTNQLHLFTRSDKNVTFSKEREVAVPTSSSVVNDETRDDEDSTIGVVPEVEEEVPTSSSVVSEDASHVDISQGPIGSVPEQEEAKDVGESQGIGTSDDTVSAVELPLEVDLPLDVSDPPLGVSNVVLDEGIQVNNSAADAVASKDNQTFREYLIAEGELIKRAFLRKPSEHMPSEDTGIKEEDTSQGESQKNQEKLVESNFETSEDSLISEDSIVTAIESTETVSNALTAAPETDDMIANVSAVLPALALAASFLGFETLVGEYGLAIAGVGMVGALGVSLAKDFLSEEGEASAIEVQVDEQKQEAIGDNMATLTAVDEMIPANIQLPDTLETIFQMTDKLEEVESSLDELEEEIANALAFECEKNLGTESLASAPAEMTEPLGPSDGDSTEQSSMKESEEVVNEDAKEDVTVAIVSEGGMENVKNEEAEDEPTGSTDETNTFGASGTWSEILSKREQEIQLRLSEQQKQIKTLEKSVADALYFANDTSTGGIQGSIPVDNFFVSRETNETLAEGRPENNEIQSSSSTSSDYFPVNWLNDIATKFMPGSRLEAMEKHFVDSIHELEEEVAEALRLAEDALLEATSEEATQERKDKNSTATN